MDKVKLMDRVETKFVLSIRQLPEILESVKKDYAVVSFDDILMPNYKTVYYDTDDFFFYKEHHRKRKDRYKVRYRNYVDSNITYFEIKHKKNGRVDKQRIKVANENFDLDKEQEEFLIENEIDQGVLNLKLINNYKRITLVSNASVERVTFDLMITFENSEVKSELDDIVIAEVKQPTLTRDTAIYKAFKDAQIKPYNVSKYCIGVIKIYGKEKVKYNRFKKKLLKLNKCTEIWK